MFADGELRGSHRDLHLELALTLLDRAATFGDVTLDAEVPGDASAAIVETDVVPLDEDRITVQSALLCFEVQPSAIEELAPDPTAVIEIVREQLARCDTDELVAGCAVLLQHRVVDLGHAMVIERVLEQRILAGAVVPGERLVQHHEEEAVERLREKELQAVVGRVHGSVSFQYPVSSFQCSVGPGSRPPA